MEMSKAVTQELYKPKIGRKIRVFSQRLKNNILMKEKSAFVSLDWTGVASWYFKYERFVGGI